MFNFSKYKFIAISISILLIVSGLITTFFVHGGFAHSLDFNGGFRAVVETSIQNPKEEIDKFFKSQGIEAIVILLDKDKNHYQIDIGLDAIEKIKTYNKQNLK
ncbi:MAG: protein translocase subunit SecF, partial [Leptospiraceae bacterium]|nr:protein translocase subunit SecF [Leptospiraceae bacterium]